jgi:hypothetical protein
MGAWMVSIDACEISPQDSSFRRRDESEARELLKFPGPFVGPLWGHKKKQILFVFSIHHPFGYLISPNTIDEGEGYHLDLFQSGCLSNPAW